MPTEIEHHDASGGEELLHEEADVHFDPIVQLEAVEVKTLEEDEEPLFERRARLYRYDNKAGEWKERGTGDLKLLKHKETKVVRVLMRREKTLKICANHRVSSDMTLKRHQGSNRTWMYTCAADFADLEPKHEVFAIRFKDKDDCEEFRKLFEEAKSQNAALAGSSGAEQRKRDSSSSSSSESSSSSDSGSDSEHEAGAEVGDRHGRELAEELENLDMGKAAKDGT